MCSEYGESAWRKLAFLCNVIYLPAHAVQSNVYCFTLQKPPTTALRSLADIAGLFLLRSALKMRVAQAEALK